MAKRIAAEGDALRIFTAKILFSEFECELQQDLVRPAFWVPKEGHPNMAVAEVEECLRPICRESSQQEEESNLDSVPAVRVFLFRSNQVGLLDFHQVLDIHRSFLPLLVTQPMFLYEFSEHLIYYYQLFGLPLRIGQQIPDASNGSAWG